MTPALKAEWFGLVDSLKKSGMGTLEACRFARQKMLAVRADTLRVLNVDQSPTLVLRLLIECELIRQDGAH